MTRKKGNAEKYVIVGELGIIFDIMNSANATAIIFQDELSAENFLVSMGENQRSDNLKVMSLSDYFNISNE